MRSVPGDAARPPWETLPGHARERRRSLPALHTHRHRRCDLIDQVNWEGVSESPCYAALAPDRRARSCHATFRALTGRVNPNCRLLMIQYQKFENEMTMPAPEKEVVGGATSPAGSTPNGSVDPSQLNFQISGHAQETNGKLASRHDVISIEEMNGPGDARDQKEEEAFNEEEDEENQVWQRTTKFLEYDAEQHEIEVEMGFVDPSHPPSPDATSSSYMQWRTRRFVEHFVVRVLTALLILVDMVILFVDLFNEPAPNDPIEYCSLAFSTYFMIEVTLRIFGLGPQVFFRAWHNVLDCFLVVFTFILSVVTVCVENMSSNPVSLIVILRLIRLVRITRIIWQREDLKMGARQFVSQNKRRYQQNGFDLDLTYVMPREVVRFMDTQHAGHYRIYNLCSERHYDESLFHGRVERFLIDDHNVPPLTDMLRFSASVKAWMEKDEKNVIAVHCKGGKGRTGTMICVFLIDLGIFRDAEHCLGYFGDRRTDKNVAKKFQGVETPSQSRYVGYYEHVVRARGQLPPETPLIVTKITLRGMYTVTVEKSKGLVHIQLINAPVVRGDTRVMFFTDSRNIPKGYENSPFFFWFHTGFISGGRLELSRHELDNPHKSKTWNVFQEDFGVTVEFEEDTMTKAY
ncbi:putative phosphatidylinositol 3,4,5-trisphosphate 3-phosphatase TPTE2-like [Penaeus vannamei]|uniref:Putative phosphatidylinositol 3,4,5-trisphosphate 3-phosphatase TPTE2-like n=1 Tax=Penaeus vannamei TaxID=6689 RepID=A0A3R7MTI7_PENVA|nr:putative phosphatidylinositol 3,4,5-trisphosphate 3-phosphatase TPTE2-like [Penaeus vannamei]